MRENIQRLWGFAKGFRSWIVLRGAVGVLRVCFSLMFVWLCKQLIDIASHVVEGNISYYIVLLVVVMICELFLSAYGGWLENRNDIRIKNKLRHNLFSHLMFSVWGGKEHFHSGDVLNRIEEDVRMTAEVLCKTFPSILVVCFQALSAFVFLCQLDKRMAWLMILIMPGFLLLSKIYMKRMHRLTKEIRTSDSRVQSHMQENIQHSVLIRTLEQSENVSDRLGFLQDVLYGQTLKRINLTTFSRALIMLGFATSYAFAFVWGVKGIYAGAITYGVMSAFLQLVGQVQRPIVELSRYIPTIAQSFSSVERLKELKDIDIEEQGKLHIFDQEVGVRMEGVSFAYPNDDRQIIKDFSFDFAPGSRTAIIGETGAGKSTLIRLMLALLRPQEGEIYLYGLSQKKEVSPLTRCNMVYVPQGNTLLSGTIRDNLLLGNPNATDMQVHDALHTAVAEFVYDLSDGLDTLCGERGSGLSEGQAQRICIARGLLRSARILLLDEFSSSLDSDTEELLMERLISKAVNKTLIFITHREMVAEYCSHVIKLHRLCVDDD